MTTRTVVIAAGFVVAAGLGSWHAQASRFEVWIADQSDTRPGFGGQVLIYQGSDLTGATATTATPARIDLGAETADLCQKATGSHPVRPHMILFNQSQTHAILSFVASGHVVIFDAESRRTIRPLRRLGSAQEPEACPDLPRPGAVQQPQRRRRPMRRLPQRGEQRHQHQQCAV